MPQNWHTLARQMVESQIRARGVEDPRVLEAMLRVPRHRFVPPAQVSEAYNDYPLPIGSGQTISQPFIVAYMLALLGLQGHEKVLEIGTGSGYQAALLGHLAREVHTIERIPELADEARARLKALNLPHVHVHTGDGTSGLPKHAPFDAIIVAAAAPEVPPPLLEQLADGGRLVIPVGGRGYQTLERWQRIGSRFQREQLETVAFVPLLGEHGW